MMEDRLIRLLQQLTADWEHECVEFKAAGTGYSTQDIGKYFSALSNEANLHDQESAWLVFGVDAKTRKPIGTNYRLEKDQLHAIKHQITQNTDPSVSFREIYELNLPEGRVIFFEIPAAPRGIPIAWSGHYYARAGESLVALSLAKQDEIRSQTQQVDWSATVCPNADLDDLDPDAVTRARDIFVAKYRDRISEQEIRGWDTVTFLDKAKLTIRGGITRACLLLLGRNESTHFLSPSVAELSWKLEGPEKGYEHFHPPFLLATTLLFQHIRNLRLTLLPPGQMIPVEISKYDQRIVLEALHNCIAHQDYTRCERILVIERQSELEFQNAGEFYDGTPDDYIRGNRMPRKYRNRLLAEAMVTLRMMDTMGFGIREVMWKGQASRYLPLPDYDLIESGHVKLRIQGRFIDENYSKALLAHADLPWPDVLALDKIQKGESPEAESVSKLRRAKLIEGRKPRLHVAAEVASATDTEADYIRHKSFDDQYFTDLILQFIDKFGGGSRADFARLLEGKLSDLLDESQKQNKINTLLQKLRRKKLISPRGKTKGAIWLRN